MSSAEPGPPEPLLSVIITCRDGERTLPCQLDSLARQETVFPWELVVVDNGSRDRSREIVRSLSSRLPVRLIEADDQVGRAHALNAGVAAAVAERIVFLDQDDAVGPGYLAAMSRALETDDFVAARVDYELLNAPWQRKMHSPIQEDALMDGLRFLPHALGCTLGVRRRVVDAVGLYDGSFSGAQDVDFCWRAQLAGFRLHFVPEAVLHWRHRDTLRGVFRQGRSYALDQVALYTKYRHSGMGRQTVTEALSAWLHTVTALRHVGRTVPLAYVIRRLAFHIGRIEGSVRHRVFYP